MSLQVLVAHTGERLTADPSSLDSIESFKAWLAKASSVPASHQILLTGAGKQAKLQAIQTEPEIYLYNRQLISSSSRRLSNPPAPTLLAESPNTTTPPAPDAVTNQNDIQSWQELFKARRAWATDLEAKSNSLANDALKHLDAFEVIEKAIEVAVENLEVHIRSLEDQYNHAKDLSERIGTQQSPNEDAIDLALRQMRTLPVDLRLIRLIPVLAESETFEKISSAVGIVSLDQIVDLSHLDEADRLAGSGHFGVADQVTKLQDRVIQINNNADNLSKSVRDAYDRAIAHFGDVPSQIMGEVEVLTAKISSDCEHVMSLSSSEQAISQASRMALIHTRNYLPTLRDYHIKLGKWGLQAREQRTVSSERAMKNMQQVAIMEKTFAQADSQVKALNLSVEKIDAFEFLLLVVALPLVYGILLIEATRRHEWTEKIRAESAVLAEDIAGYKDEEERRRRKWVRNANRFIILDAGTALNFEINIKSDETEWPDINRDTVQQYLQAIREVDGLESFALELDNQFKELDKPTRRQAKTAKNFRNGSLHEGANGLRGSFLLRENDETNTLRANNAKLEDEVKSQKSRVRKLEDMLYRQSQPVRQPILSPVPMSSTPPLVSNQGFSPSTPPLFNEHMIRRPSQTSRRSSANMTQEDKSLARRIVGLEAELYEEKQKRSTVEKALEEERLVKEKLSSDFEEVKSTKTDLMANLEAQQGEFAIERRGLEEELEKQKLRVEEAEDELDRVLGSRDNDRLGIEDRLRSLEAALEESKVQKSNLQMEISRREEAQQDQIQAMRAIRLHLNAEAEAPISTHELLKELDELSERSMRQARDLEQGLATMKEEKTSLRHSIDEKDEELKRTRRTIQKLEEDILYMRNEQMAEQTRSKTLSDELEDGRKQLRELRAKFADGETGSEALRQRVEDQASRASHLAAELAESKSHVNSLDVELSNLQTRHARLQSSAAASSSRLEERSERAQELSNRLVKNNVDLVKLLDALGLSALMRDGSLYIQRSSKLVNNGDSVTEASMVASGSTSLAQFGKAFDPAQGAGLLQWMHVKSSEEEKKAFESLISFVDSFNLTTFSEAVIKLRRDVEWTGKKWKMEARGYRDKHHRSQNEAHDKIAVRTFKEGDLALFLPTRNQATKPWAAFNIGAPHYFLREQSSHQLRNREWLVARISKIEERVVDLSKNMTDSLKADGRSIGETSEGATSVDNDNPFELSDGLRWYLVDAAEEKASAPSTPGLGKTTVASAHVDVKGSIRMKKPSAGNDASTKLNKNLESRRSSTNSKRGSISSGAGVSKADPGATNNALGDVPRSPSSTHLRPGSRSSVGPSSLGLEITNAAPTVHQGVGTADEQVTKQAPSSSPAQPSGFFNFLNSPPKSWLVGNKNTALDRTREPSPSKPLPSDARPSRSAVSPARISQPHSNRASPAKSTKSSKSNTSPKKGDAGESRGRQKAWESLVSLDLNLEESNSKGKGKPSS